MRPFESHSRQGADSWLAGKSEADNPHREGTLAHVEWLGGHLDAMVESGDLDETAQDCARVYLDDTEIEAGRMASRLRRDLPTATAVADAIGVPVVKWKGNCFAVSVAALESGILDEYQEKYGTLFPAYGMYDGPLAEGRRLLNRHGWLESVEGHVVDPTRWVFTDEYPHLWAGKLDEYDLGAMRLRSAHRPYAAPAPEGEPVRLATNDRRDLLAFDRVFRDGRTSASGAITRNRLHWLLTSPLEQMGENAPMFVAIADRMGASGLVPIDTRLWIDFSVNGYDPSKLRVAHADIPELVTDKSTSSYSPMSVAGRG